MSQTQKVTFQHVQESAYQPSRRQFLKRFLGGVAASVVIPSIGFPEAEALSNPLVKAGRALAPNDVGDERFWSLVKEQFPLRRGLILMNSANLCPSPYPVFETVFGLTRDVDSDASFPNRSKFKDLHEQSLQALGEYLGASSDELVITRNTSEGNNMVINGLDLKAGDEVVIWDQNHPTCNVAWDVRAQRYGFTVKKVSTPTEPKSPEDLLTPFYNAFTKNTKVLGFSHVSNISGIALPAKELCRSARERDILTLVDGAQTFGVFALNLHDLGCDFFTGSGHKWFMGPKEGGLLYVRKDRVDDLWPTIVGVGWEQARDKGARKFGTLGQRDDAALAAMGKTVTFHNNIGKERVEKRVRQLVAALQEEIKKKMPDASFISPTDPVLGSGVLVFKPHQKDLSQTVNTLYQKHLIGCTVFGGDRAGIRLSPHIFNTLEEAEKVIDAIAGLT